MQCVQGSVSAQRHSKLLNHSILLYCVSCVNEEVVASYLSGE